MAITNIPQDQFDGLHIHPWTTDTGAADNGTLRIDGGVTTDPNIIFTTPPETTWAIRPDCTEAITILEEAEYELKELLKKTPATVNIGPKGPQDFIEIALRSTQAALRALLKI